MTKGRVIHVLHCDQGFRAWTEISIPERDADDGLEMSDDSCGECGHPYKRGDETHYPECSRIEVK